MPGRCYQAKRRCCAPQKYLKAAAQKANASAPSVLSGWQGRLNHWQMLEGFGIEQALLLPNGARPRADEVAHIAISNLAGMAVHGGNLFVNNLANIHPEVGVIGGEEVDIQHAMC